MHEVGSVQRKGVELTKYPARRLPASAERIGVVAYQRVHAMLEQPVFDVARRRGGEIDHPLFVDAVQLRRPDQFAAGAALRLAPDHDRFGMTQIEQRAGVTQLQPIIGRYGGDKVVVLLMAQDKGIGPLFNKGIRPGCAHFASPGWVTAPSR